MPYFTRLLFFFLAANTICLAQVRMPEYDLNKNLPGAQYKFSFVHMSDTHIGEDVSDFGTPGYFNDTADPNDTSSPSVRLRRAVRWINDHEADKNIKFVVVSGDLTGSAERSEFELCKDILDSLNMPYVPVIGNHDIWPYVRYQDEAPYACGDSVMGEVFADVYDKDKLFFDNWNDGTRLTRTFNPESGLEHYLQNFSFEYDDFIFYALDFNPRYHVNKPEPGIGPEAQLMDWPGGTFRWWRDELTNNPRKKNHNVCFISHHPATENILFILSNFVFAQDEYYKIIQMLTPFKNNLGVWMAGHIHINYDYALINNVMRVRGVAANKDFDSSHFEIINVYEAPFATPVLNSRDEKEVAVYPNPNNGKFTVSQELFDPAAVLKLYDLVGNLVFEKRVGTFAGSDDMYQFDFSSLPRGSYLLVHSAKDRHWSQRLVMQ